MSQWWFQVQPRIQTPNSDILFTRGQFPDTKFRGRQSHLSLRNWRTEL